MDEKMNSEVKERWIEALESGKFPQTHRTLADANGFCCLGVLCEIAVEDQVVTRGSHLGFADEGIVYYEGENGFASAMLPEDVWMWAGLPNENPLVWIKDVVRIIGHEIPDFETSISSSVTLATLNDRGLSFEEIAKVIRELL